MNFLAYSYIERTGKLDHIFTGQNEKQLKCKRRQYCCKIKIAAIEILFLLQLFHPSFNPMIFFFLTIFSGWFAKQKTVWVWGFCAFHK